MSSKPGRTRKVPNKEPTSLARPALLPFIPPAIDPQLLALDNSLLAVANDSDNDISSLTGVNSIVPFITSPKSKHLSTILKATINKLQDELQNEPQDELNPESKPILVGVKSALQWTLKMEKALFNKLLEQANIGKRVDNGFKKEAWTASCTAVELITTQSVTIDQCKSKAETMKALWKEFE